MYIQTHVVVGTKRYIIGHLSGKAAPQTPLPKFDQPGSLGTNFGIIPISKILHAAKCCFRPIGFARIGRPVLAFCAIYRVSFLFTLTEKDQTLV